MRNIVVRSKEKKSYVAPAIEIVRSAGKNVLYTASPGVGSGYDPGSGFEAPRHDLDIEFKNVWEE